jgi:hypothetical protein
VNIKVFKKIREEHYHSLRQKKKELQPKFTKLTLQGWKPQAMGITSPKLVKHKGKGGQLQVHKLQHK